MEGGGLNGLNSWNCFSLVRFPRPLLPETFFYFVKLHDVAVLVMHVEEIDLVREQAPVEDTFLDDGNMITQRVGVHATRSDAAAGAFTADDQAIDPFLSQMRDQRRAKKTAGAFFEDHRIAWLGLELLPD